MKALLIVDMQNGSFPAERPVFNKEEVIMKINQLSESFRNTRNKVIFIRHDGTKQGQYIPESHDWQIISSLKMEKGDIVLSKTVNDAFYHSELKSILDINEIDTLVITGYASDFCVDTTIRSALNKDYKVIVARDAHTTFGRSFVSAETIIRHHNIIWENLIPAMHKVEVKTCDQITGEITADSLNSRIQSFRPHSASGYCEQQH